MPTTPVNRVPTGPPAPTSGWHVDLADDFNVPLGTGPGQDNLWYPTQDWNKTPSVAVNGNNPDETEVYSSDEVAVQKGNLVLSARYQNDAAPGAGDGSGRNEANRRQRNFVASIVTSPTDEPGYKGFSWTPGDGSTWAFEIDCRFPPDTIGLFNSFWTSSLGTWSNERDFFEAHSGNRIDTTWIYRTPVTGGYESSFYGKTLGFDPSAAMHRYTYVVNPNQSWSLYIDGALQTWVGVDGVAPPKTSSNTPMELIMNYALNGSGFTSGSNSFLINSVAVYQDNAHAGKSMSGGGIAPGTTVAK